MNKGWNSIENINSVGRYIVVAIPDQYGHYKLKAIERRGKGFKVPEGATMWVSVPKIKKK